MRCAYLCYQQGPHRAHKRQAKALNPEIVPMRLNVFPTGFKTYDLLISEGFRPSIMGFLMKRMHMTEWHINLLLGDFMSSIIKKSCLKRLVDLIYRDCDGIIANSSLTADIYQKHFGKKYTHKLKVCWPIANIKPFRERAVKNVDRASAICYLGHLTHLDGADLLSEIFYRIQNELNADNIDMYIIGTGIVYEKLLQIAEKEENFHVLGYQPRNIIKEVFKKCLIFVYPARLKFFGLPVIEAMAAGLIPIVTEMTGARDLVKRVNSKLVTPVDVNIISEKIVEILRMGPKEKIELSQKAKYVAIEHVETAKITFESFLRNFLHQSQNSIK